MWIAIITAGALLLILLVMFRGKSSPVASASPAAQKLPARAAPAAPPRIGAADDVDDELTVAAKLIPKIDTGPESTRVQRLDPLPEQHETDDEEEDDQTGLRRLILMNAVARTDAGLLRKHNEDHYLVLEEYGLFVVADGMGGHAGGEIASGLAAEAIGNAFRKQTFPGLRKVTKYRRANELVRSFELANDEIRRVAAENSELHDMGTTCVAARFSPSKERVYIASAGDSRVYRIRDGAMVQLTKDHTLAVEAGAKGSIGAHLTRALGIGDVVHPDILVEDARPGDQYLLCSDGLTKMLSDEDIRASVSGSEIALVAQRLVAAANERGGRDNITVILVRVEPAKS